MPLADAKGATMKRPENIFALSLVLILASFAIYTDMQPAVRDDHPSIEAEIDAAMVTQPGVYGSPVQDLRAEYAAAYHRARVAKLKEIDHCEACGTTAALECHHVISVDRIFHEGLDPKLIGDESNLIVLCRTNGAGCHKAYGHPDGWGKSNPRVRQDAERASKTRMAL